MNMKGIGLGLLIVLAVNCSGVWASDLTDLADSMAPGQFARLTLKTPHGTDLNFINQAFVGDFTADGNFHLVDRTFTNAGSTIRDPQQGEISQWTNMAPWNPTLRQWLFMAGSHGAPWKLLQYDEPTNVLSMIGSPTESTQTKSHTFDHFDTEPAFNGAYDASEAECHNHDHFSNPNSSNIDCIGHGYGHNAIDTVRNHLHHRYYNTRAIFSRNMNTANWLQPGESGYVPEFPSSVIGSPDCCISLHFVAGASNGTEDNLYIIDFQFPEIGKYDKIADTGWVSVTHDYGFAGGGTQGRTTYSPLKRKIYITPGGAGAGNFYSFDVDTEATATLASLPDTPTSNGLIMFHDPVSGEPMIIVCITGDCDEQHLYQYDSNANDWVGPLSWTVKDEGGLPSHTTDPPWDEFNNVIYETFAVLATPIDHAGVIMFSSPYRDSNTFWLYKHQATSTADLDYRARSTAPGVVLAVPFDDTNDLLGDGSNRTLMEYVFDSGPTVSSLDPPGPREEQCAGIDPHRCQMIDNATFASGGGAYRAEVPGPSDNGNYGWLSMHFGGEPVVSTVTGQRLPPQNTAFWCGQAGQSPNQDCFIQWRLRITEEFLDHFWWESGVKSTSTSSQTIGLGLKTFVLNFDAGYSVGDRVAVQDAVDSRVNYMIGDVTFYDGPTQTVTVDMHTSQGSGTLTSWLLQDQLMQGGWKVALIAEGNQAGHEAPGCADNEIAVINSSQRGGLGAYHSCGAKSLTNIGGLSTAGQFEGFQKVLPNSGPDFSYHNAITGPFDLDGETFDRFLFSYKNNNPYKGGLAVQNLPFNQRFVEPAVPFRINQWMTIQVQIHVGTWYQNDGNFNEDSIVKIWFTLEGGTTVLLLDTTLDHMNTQDAGTDPGYDLTNCGVSNPCPAASNIGYGRIDFLPQMTRAGFNANQQAFVWIDELIISSQRIPDPGDSGGGALPPVNIFHPPVLAPIPTNPMKIEHHIEPGQLAPLPSLAAIEVTP